ncbi:serine/threonine-protein kinase LMTK1-like isoform X2 [Chiloscyllium plagiosum]|uniref:serine/threonine-protein kinase LMTK1-like isoform X2 n=1 Tax=Chiloscyllium plagiosum TaxID=36176 RepID=UPI001CB84D6D|nr:serine/threonine-protein kinase LMTK1-like isoform X2 [Chiloscyllium plagiosum]
MWRSLHLRLVWLLLCSGLCNPSLAFSSHFDPDGMPIGELTWSSSLAVVAVSFSGLFTFIFLMLACLCCKKGDIGFKEPISAVKHFSQKEFENNEGEDYTGEFSPRTTSSSQNGPEVYILPLTEVSFPVSNQPAARPGHFLHQTDLGRQSLLYLKEAGSSWFGKVFLGEVNINLNCCQVVVKELKAEANIQEQMRFLEEAQPHRSLQHPNLLQCLAQFTEVTPYLLVMEFCQLGDLKGYLRTHNAADELAPDPSTLQRMACEITSGLQYLHKHNYIHSDMALRNCLLSADLTVKIGDYGLSHNKYKKDYFVTPDQLWIPLRWIAPELIDDVHGNLLVVDQTKISNIWSLGVTLWELFEFGNQPYHRCSDKEVLTYAIKEQQLKLPKPLLNLPLSDRWYEVMQFCWLQPDQRPTADEVHLLLSYLCAKASNEAEEEFEKRWNAMKPSGSSTSHTAEASSFPLLEQFGTDGFHTEVDDVLTVTETSQGLNFEYKWDHTQMDNFPPSTTGLSHGSSQYQEIYFPNSASGRLSLSVSPVSSNSFYESKQQSNMPQNLQPPGIVPVISAHSPSVTGEYYIRIEEPTECNMDLDYTMCSYSPEYDSSVHMESSSWQGLQGRDNVDDCENSPTLSLTMEPLLGQVSSATQDSWEDSQYFSKNKSQSYYEQFTIDDANQYLLENYSENGSDWKVQSAGENSSEDPLGISPVVTSSFRDSSALLVTSYHELDETGSDRTFQSPAAEVFDYAAPSVNTALHSVDDLESVKKLIVGYPSPAGLPSRKSTTSSSSTEDENHFPSGIKSWESSNFLNNNRIDLTKQSLEQVDVGRELFQTEFSEPDLHKVGNVEPLSLLHTADTHNSTVIPLTETENGSSNWKVKCKEVDWESQSFDQSLSTALYNIPQQEESQILISDRLQSMRSEDLVDPLLGQVVKSSALGAYSNTRIQTESGEVDLPGPDTDRPSESDQLDVIVQETNQLKIDREEIHNPTQLRIEIEVRDSNAILSEMEMVSDTYQVETAVREFTSSPQFDTADKSDTCFSSDVESKELDSSPVKTLSSVSFAGTDGCSDEDETDITSGIFTDLTQDYENSDLVLSHKSLQKLVGTPDSLESLDIPSTTSSCEMYSPTSHYSSLQPKAADSGYDTENFESPEFVLKEPVEQKDPELFTKVSKPSNAAALKLGSDGVEMLQDSEPQSINEKNPYRDSAYFSDYDAESEKYQTLDSGKDDLVQGEIDLLELNEGDLTESPLQDVDYVYLGSSQTHNQTDLQLTESPETAGSNLGNGNLIQRLHRDPAEGLASCQNGCSEEVSILIEKQMDAAPNNPDAVVLATAELKLGSQFSSSATSEGFHKQDVELENDEKEIQADDLLCEQILEEAGGSNLKKGEGFLQSSYNSENPLKKQVSSRKKGYPHKTSGCVFDGTELILEEQLTEQCSESVGIQCTDVETRKFQMYSLNVEEKLESCIVPKVQSIQLSLELPLLDLKKEPRQGFEGEEGEEEDEDDDESDDSDEELGIYNIQEHSEESEEELPTVPIIVTEKDDGKNLRSLLKLPNLVCETFCDDLDRKKKVVSFYDDVTVYLFDQESPTGELSEQNIPDVDPTFQHHPEELQNKGAGVSTATQRQNTSKHSSDENASEESGGFEWDDDFPLVSVRSSLEPEGSSLTSDPASAAVLSGLEQSQVQKTHFSRFTISPATVSRFSITHVLDSEIESLGESIEEGERE